MLKINVSNILSNRKFKEESSFSITDLSPDIKLSGPLLVSTKIISKGSSVVVYFKIKGKETITCDKCLEEFERDLYREFSQEYIQELPNKDDELNEFAGFKIDKKGNINLKSAIIEEILVNDMGLNICSSGCKGLCPKCGINLNKNKCSCYNNNEGDNPFAKLSKLKEK